MINGIQEVPMEWGKHDTEALKLCCTGRIRGNSNMAKRYAAYLIDCGKTGTDKPEAQERKDKNVKRNFSTTCI